jgi:hypothetical protein
LQINGDDQQISKPKRINGEKTNGENIIMEPITPDDVNVVIPAPEKSEKESKFGVPLKILIHLVVLCYFAYVTFHYITTSEFIFYFTIMMINSTVYYH